MCGLLLVFSEPGAKVNDETEFNDWYDNEHIPGLHTLPSFLATERYKSADSLSPTYLTLHNLISCDFEYILTGAAFQSLLANASARERSIIPRLQTFSGRAYQPLFELSSSPSTDLVVVPRQKSPKYLLLVSIDLIDTSLAFESSLNLWYNTVHIPTISRTAGWVRSRRFELQDGVEISTKGQPEYSTNFDEDSSASHAYQYIALHEFTTDSYVSDHAMVAAFQSKEAQHMHMLPKVKLEFRHFVLHREF
ncbi:hypothetical protein BJ165DRAFT_1400809 [Panaeolus papilionaceus]|nr:hypothetical protein BJ165DRAFT_1400809 [Panaeolus papilionaceus]